MATGYGASATARPSRSIFTQSLAERLQREGIEVPDRILDLLDTPFASFTEEDKHLYEEQVKGKELMFLFSRLLSQIYESQPEASKHSWRSMGFLLKDCPVKVCVTYVLRQAEEGQEKEVGMMAREWSHPTDGSGVPLEVAGVEGDAPRKSYFTKKLEHKLEERGIKVPASIIALLDKPYDKFTPEDRRIYEQEFEGRQLKILFSDLLDELFEETGRVVSGWTAMCRFLKDTPMKDIALYVIAEEERLEAVSQQPSPLEGERDGPVREKFYVKPYRATVSDKTSSRKRKA